MGLFSFLSGVPAKPALPAVSFQVPALLPKLAPASGGAAALSPLLAEGKMTEAVNVLAHGLPPHDAVRWATESSAVGAATQTAADRAATAASQQWLKSPTAANQAVAAKAALDASHAGPGAWAAQAAAWAPPTVPTAGAITPVVASAAPAAAVAGIEAPVAAPTSVAPGLVGQAVAGSVMLAAAGARPGFDLKQHLAAAAPAATPAGATAALPAAAPLAPEAVRALCQDYKPFIDRGLAIAAGTA